MTTSVGQALAERALNAGQPMEQQAELALRSDQTEWTDKQRAALAVLGIKGASDAELAVYMHVCQRTGLDPFAKQIYFIERREKVSDNQGGEHWVSKWTIQVGIDGFRVTRDRVAARTGYEVEFEDTLWYDAEGGEHAVWVKPEAPAACKVVLLKHRLDRPDLPPRRFPGVLRTAAYMPLKNGNPMGQWRTMAEHQIEKCCEAFATRRAFPNDLGGVYIEEEMSVAEVVAEAQPQQRRQRGGNGAQTIAGAVEDSGKPKTRKQALDAVVVLFNSVGLEPLDARTAVAAVMANPAGTPLELASANDLNAPQMMTLHATLADTIDRAKESGKDPREILLAIARAGGWQPEPATKPDQPEGTPVTSDDKQN